MARRRKYSYRRHVAAWKSGIRRGLKSGRYRSKCTRVTRKYCFTTRGKPVSCKGAIGKQYKKPITRTFGRCRDARTNRFIKSEFCKRSC